MKRTGTHKKASEDLTAFREILSNTSVLLSRFKLMGSLGKQYGTSRDIYEALGYPDTSEITYTQMLIRYGRQDIAGAIIDRPVDSTWKGAVQVIETEDAEHTQFEKTWDSIWKTFRLKSKLMRVDKLTSLGGYGALILGLSDVKNAGEDMASPVSGTVKLTFIKPVSCDKMEVAEWVKDGKDPRYGLPMFYNITIDQPSGDGQTFRVHWHRVIHITADLLDNDIEGLPALQPVWNRLLDLEKIVGGSAEMYWRGARPGYAGEVDKDFELTTKQREDLQAQIDEYEHNLRRILINTGIKYNPLTAQVSDPSNHVLIQVQMISTRTGIPSRVLLGSELGQLASSQDASNWAAFVQTRREEYAETEILRPLVERFIQFKILPEPKDGFSVMWPDVFNVSDKELSEVGEIRANALKAYTTNPSAESILPPEAFFEYMMGLDQDEIDLIKQMVEEHALKEPPVTPQEQATLDAEAQAQAAAAAAQGPGNGNGK